VLLCWYSMKTPLKLHVDTQSPIPIRRQLTEQLKHVIENGSLPQNQTLPSIRELAGFRAENGCAISLYLDLDPSVSPTAARARSIASAFLSSRIEATIVKRRAGSLARR